MPRNEEDPDLLLGRPGWEPMGLEARPFTPSSSLSLSLSLSLSCANGGVVGLPKGVFLGLLKERALLPPVAAPPPSE